MIEQLNIGDVKSVEKVVDRQQENHICLHIRAENESYNFFIKEEGGEILLGKAQTKYLSSEVAGGFTGVVIGLYAQDKNAASEATFTKFRCEYLQHKSKELFEI